MTDETIGKASFISHLRLRSWRGVVFPAWLFVILAPLLLALLVLLGFLVVVSVTYTDSGYAEFASSSSRLDRTLSLGWALLSSAALLWALVNLHWSHQAAQARGESKPLAAYGHLAMAVGCGLIVFGIYSVLIAQSFGTQPIVMDYSHLGRKSKTGSPVAVAAMAGDAVEGQKVFSTTCITCHGPTGGGLPNLAPSLRGSPFIASADDVSIASVIRLGRAATDPNSKTKKVMPARGGNPFLGDDKIAHLVAYVREIQNSDSGSSVEAAAGGLAADAPAPIQISNWVVPDAPRPPAGMVSIDQREDIGDDISIRSRDDRRRHGMVQAFTLALTSVHCLFLIGVMIASSNVVFCGLVQEEQRDDDSLWRWSTLGWIVAFLVWCVIFLFGFILS